MTIFNLIYEDRQKESGRRLILAAALALGFIGPLRAEDGLDAGGLTFKDFAIADRGASFNRGDPMIPDGPGPAAAHVLEIDNNHGLARLRFDSVKVEVAVPLGWQARDESQRGIAYSADQSYRLIVWRLDFAFEGVRDAEQYAATKVGAIEARHREVKAAARKLGDGSFLVVYENAPPSRGDHERRTVYDLVTPDPGNAKVGVLMTLGVPTSEAERGLRLLALLKSNTKMSW